ncbi:MAG: hypothetical protein P9L94_10880 [Candidatus Hinthialibacter antarcticus]|nr:hypothetical protein [Candidatus Hinthialibacter antarcticus]
MTNNASTQTASFNGPWSSTGRLFDRYPIIAAALAFAFFWLHRSQVFSGDGNQLSRFLEDDIWMVQSELLSHATLQAVYQLLTPLGWNSLSVMNLISCLAGAAAVWAVLIFNRECCGCDPLWSLALFFSSGFLILSCGHTEYYTMFIATLFLFGLYGVRYLNNQASSTQAGLAYSLGLWMHLGILFAAPAVLLLPILKKRMSDYKGLAIGLSPCLAAYLFREFSFMLGIEIKGLSPDTNFVPLFPDPTGVRFYGMFEWGHLVDILYAWTMRSWIFWPVILLSITLFGRQTILRKDRVFLLVSALCFTLLALVWHPNLGVEQDWDLFSFEAAPCLLLVLTYLPDFLKTSFRRWALAIPIAASFLIVYAQIAEEARFGRRAMGAAKIELSQPIDSLIRFNGAIKDADIPVIRQGGYEIRIIDRTNRNAYLRYAAVVSGETTLVPIKIQQTTP